MDPKELKEVQWEIYRTGFFAGCAEIVRRATDKEDMDPDTMQAACREMFEADYAEVVGVGFIQHLFSEELPN